MNRWLDVVAGVVLGLVVNECTAVSPWLAHKTVRWAAVIRRPDRIDEFVEVRSATINDRPGKLFKLFTALGFLFAALAYRAAEPGPAGRPDRTESGTITVVFGTAVIAPVYGVAQAVRASLRKSCLLTGAGSMAAVGVVIITGVAVLDTTTSYDHFTEILIGICLGVVGGLHVGVGLLVIEDITKQWNTVVATPPDAVPPVGRQNSALDR